MSKRVRGAIPAYMRWKYEADTNLVNRGTFKWTILRPGGLSNDPGTGKASVGRTHLRPTIPVSGFHSPRKASSQLPQRDDVAKALCALLDREDAAGLAIDIVGGGDENIEQGIDAFIKKGETDFPL